MGSTSAMTFGDWVNTNWSMLLTFAGMWTTTVVGLAMYLAGHDRRITVVENNQERDTKRHEELKAHIDARMDRMETKLDLLFVPRGTRGDRNAG